MRGFRARAGKAHPLRTGDQPVDELGPAHLQFVTGTPVRAELRLLANGLEHGRMAVTQQQGAMAAEVIDVFIAVDVPLARSRRACGIDRVRQQRAAVVRQSGRNDLARSLIELGGTARTRPILSLNLRVRLRYRHCSTSRTP